MGAAIELLIRAVVALESIAVELAKLTALLHKAATERAVERTHGPR